MLVFSTDIVAGKTHCFHARVKETPDNWVKTKYQLETTSMGCFNHSTKCFQENKQNINTGSFRRLCTSELSTCWHSSSCCASYFFSCISFFVKPVLQSPMLPQTAGRTIDIWCEWKLHEYAGLILYLLYLLIHIWAIVIFSYEICRRETFFPFFIQEELGSWSWHLLLFWFILNVSNHLDFGSHEFYSVFKRLWQNYDKM